MLTRHRQRGSAALESVFAMLILLLLVLGAIEVGFALYARNVVAAATHEGARAAIETSRSEREARLDAADVIERAAGGLVSPPDVAVDLRDMSDGRVEATVVVRARIELLGPVPIEIPVRTTARVSGYRTVP